MRSFAVINFKGGVGKSTISWLLAKYLSSQNKRVLLVDADPQMSLTLSIVLDENGNILPDYEQWQNERDLEGTLFRMLIDIAVGRNNFNFNDVPIKYIYKFQDSFSFLPSDDRLFYVQALEQQINNNYVRDSMINLLQSLQNQFDYVIYDCPPTFSQLTRAILIAVKNLLVPINPDIFSPKGVNILLNAWAMPLAQLPMDSRFLVFMNKVRLYNAAPNGIARKRWEETMAIINHAAEVEGRNIVAVESYLPEYAAIRDAIQRGELPLQQLQYIEKLWNDLDNTLQ